MEPENLSSYFQRDEPNDNQPPPKRLRTRRACDYCRLHRIRCDFGTNQTDDDTCKHCRRFQIPCSKAAKPPPDKRLRAKSLADAFAELGPLQGLEPSYLGPSNLSQLIRDHCATYPAALHVIRNLEDRLDVYDEAFKGPHDRGRLIGRAPEASESARRRAIAATTFSRVEDSLIEQLGGETILNDLVATCQRSFLPLFPAVSVHESLGRSNPTQDFKFTFGNFHVNSTPPTALPRAMRLILCGIPAASRTVPVRIREALAAAIDSVMDSMDASLGTASLANVQMFLCMSVNDGMWKRGPLGKAVYSATRMAMDLALHRLVSVSSVPIAQINRRKRIWSACIIQDRWMTLRLGQVPSIDLSYADAIYPSHLPDHIPVGTEGPTVQPCFRFNLEMTKLAVLLGRAYQMSYTLLRLEQPDDFMHLLWQVDYQLWRDQLPQTWPYSARMETPQATSILNLLSVAALYTFVQPFLWPTRPVPEVIAYRPPESFLHDLESLSRKSIEWACGRGTFYLDTWSMLIHPFICCLIVQAEAATKGDFTAGLLLDRGIEVIREWATAGKSPQFVTYKRKDIVEMVEALKTKDAIPTFELPVMV